MAIKPVRADSRIPKGEMSFRKESIRDGFADLGCVSQYLVASKFWESPRRFISYISTMQLLLLISSTFPPNWCAK